jgi:FkbM family methyltransferase
VLSSAARVVAYTGLMGLCNASYHEVRGLTARLLGRPYVRRRVYEHDMYLDPHDRGISRTLLLFGRRELEHKRLLELIVRPGMTIFDIGANIGYYVLIESRLVGDGGRIIAVEPSSKNVQMLRQNLRLNRVANVVEFEGGVSDSVGERNLHVSSRSNLNTFHPPEAGDYHLSGELVPVATTTVPQLASEFGPPDLMRMDVEGHEVEVLTGMLEDVEAGRLAPTVILEVHRNRYSPSHDFSEVLKRMFAAGYRTQYAGSSQASGTREICALGYEPIETIKTDFMERSIFANINNEHTIDLVCRRGGIRTLVLAKG